MEAAPKHVKGNIGWQGYGGSQPLGNATANGRGGAGKPIGTEWGGSNQIGQLDNSMSKSNIVQNHERAEPEHPLMTGTEPTYVWLAERLDKLRTEAQFLVNDYWARLKAGREGQKPHARGSLGVRLKPRETGAFSIEWYEMGVIRVHGQQRSIARKTYARGRSYEYPLKKMLNGEPEWVANLVTEVEKAFAEIRKQMALLINIRDALVAYDKEVRGTRFTAMEAMQAAAQRVSAKAKETETEGA